ncbi:hypothetical protein [Paenibacillus fonticola]|uniref:hypothetical protein n=1 Tax=Paenibacillus fonticola TaxID=379896 RepID=UPI00036CAF96|nr:hypothetical protein [Paenibacillus fonticola]
MIGADTLFITVTDRGQTRATGANKHYIQTIAIALTFTTNPPKLEKTVYMSPREQVTMIVAGLTRIPAIEISSEADIFESRPRLLTFSEVAELQFKYGI